MVHIKMLFTFITADITILIIIAIKCVLLFCDYVYTFRKRKHSKNVQWSPFSAAQFDNIGMGKFCLLCFHRIQQAMLFHNS